MVEIEFINGDNESIELENQFRSVWNYDEEKDLFIIHSVNGEFWYPREFIKSIKYIK